MLQSPNPFDMVFEVLGLAVVLISAGFCCWRLFFRIWDVDDPSNIYKVLKLDKSNSEIRLLLLKPGDWQDPIKCQLKVYGIDTKKKFVALSYAWHEHFPFNTPNKKNVIVRILEYLRMRKLSRWFDLFLADPRKRTIKVNGRDLAIGVNLELALRHQRHKSQSKTLWADAICINQDNVRDRNHQVKNIREVYRKAEKVEIWLGAARDVRGIDDDKKPDLSCRKSPSIVENPRDGADVIWSKDHLDFVGFGPMNEDHDRDHMRAMRCVDSWLEYNNRPKSQRVHMTPDYDLEFFTMIYKFSHEAFASCDVKDTDKPRKPLDERIPFLQSATARGPILEVFEEFMNRLWWNRLWVVQETVIGKSVSVRYGRFVVPWEVLCQAASNFSLHRHRTCCSTDFERFPSAHVNILQRFADTVTGLNTWRAAWNKDFENNHNKIRLLRLLWEFRSRSTSNLHDKVYALLPLVNDWGKAGKLEPQYELRVEGVYNMVVRPLIEVEKSLKFLMGNTHKSAKLNTLASWVPDWSQPPEAGELARLERAPLYFATPPTNDETLHYRVLGRNKYLELRGVKHDTVEEISDIMPEEKNAKSYAAIQQTFEKWQGLAGLKQSGKHQYVGRADTGSLSKRESRNLAFAKTICMDTVWVDRNDDDNDVEINKKNYQRTRDYAKKVFQWNKPYGNVVGEFTKEQREEMQKNSARKMTFADSRDPQQLSRTGSYAEHDISMIDKAVESATVSRRFFITKERFMGLGPADMRKGDHVFVLCGSSVPFILRDQGKRCIPDIEEEPDIQNHSVEAESAAPVASTEGLRLGLERAGSLPNEMPKEHDVRHRRLPLSVDSGFAEGEDVDDQIEDDAGVGAERERSASVAWFSTGHANDHANDHPSDHLNGPPTHHSNGHINGYTNGHVNGYTTGFIASMNSPAKLGSIDATVAAQPKPAANATSQTENDTKLEQIEQFQGDKPFDLRGASRTDHSEQCYSLIGDCYLHGIMDGEALYRRDDDGVHHIEPGLVYLV